MSTRCKFSCLQVAKTAKWNQPGAFLYNAKFIAVTGPSPENKTFWEATPSGVLEVCSIISDQFIPGREYYLDITLAEEAT